VRGRRQVVTAFVLDPHTGKALVVRRSDQVRDFQGLWGGVSGGVEEGDASLLARALAEVREEVGLGADSLTFVRYGMPLPVDDGDHRFLVHPFLFRWTGGGSQGLPPPVRLNWENTEASFVSPEELAALPHVPLLPETLERVLSRNFKAVHELEEILKDRASGAAQLADAALEALGRAWYGEMVLTHDRSDEAYRAMLDRWRAFAFLLATARPSMAAVANAVVDSVDEELAMKTQDYMRTDSQALYVVRERNSRSQARAIEAAARAIFRRWHEQERPQQPEIVVLALSYSSMVYRTLARLAELVNSTTVADDPPSVVLGGGVSIAAGQAGPPSRRLRLVIRMLESRPLFEGVHMVNRMVAAPDWELELFTDAQMAVAARGATALLVGADAVTPERGVINKVGTFAAALVCRELGVPVFAVTDALKITPGPVMREGVLGRAGPGYEEDEEEMAAAEVTAAWAQHQDASRISATSVRVRNVYFEATPLRLITGGVVTGEGGEEQQEEGGGASGGVLSADDVAREAARRREQYDRVFGLLG
jgi:translation initiation factor 2B subunit (eIF-2B alpha/beta/delta family)/8-oxo-dGTP pyrophosphatase MutT (NUDIX family)